MGDMLAQKRFLPATREVLMRWIGAAFLFLPTGVSGAQPTAPRVRIVEELRLDANVEDFPSVGRIHVGPSGQIVVPIQADAQLRIYDASGGKLAVVGRRGAGPGEFTSFGLVGWVHDTMWASDPRQRRTTYVGHDYRVLRTESWPGVQYGSTGSYAFMDPVMALPGGDAILQGMEVTPAHRRAVLLHRTVDGTQREILVLPASDSSRSIQVGPFGFALPFTLQPQHAFAPSGQHIAQLTAGIPARQDATFHVTVIAITGDTVFSRDYPYRGIPIPRRAADSAVAVTGPVPGHLINPPADLKERVQAIARERMPRWYIAPETITLGLDQTIWIGMRPTDEGRGYLILNGRGDPIGSLMVPASTRVRQASATHIWVTETDDDGLSSVVRHRVLGLGG
jgi:hypothetical protein